MHKQPDVHGLHEAIERKVASRYQLLAAMDAAETSYVVSFQNFANTVFGIKSDNKVFEPQTANTVSNTANPRINTVKSVCLVCF